MCIDLHGIIGTCSSANIGCTKWDFLSVGDFSWYSLCFNTCRCKTGDRVEWQYIVTPLFILLLSLLVLCSLIISEFHQTSQHSNEKDADMSVNAYEPSQSHSSTALLSSSMSLFISGICKWTVQTHQTPRFLARKSSAARMHRFQCPSILMPCRS